MIRIDGLMATCPSCGSVAVHSEGPALRCERCGHIGLRSRFVAQVERALPGDRPPILDGRVLPVRPLDE